MGTGVVAVYQSGFWSGAYFVKKCLHRQGGQFFCLFFFKIVFHQFTGFVQQFFYGMGAGTAAHKGIVAAKKTFSAWKAQLGAGNFGFIGPDHVNVEKTSKG